MSKKTTDELADWLMGQVCTERDLTPVITKSILAENRENLARTIAKLRAADALCEAAKELNSTFGDINPAIRAYEEA